MQPLAIPDLRPDLPDYPALPDCVRTTGAALAGTSVYPAMLCQYTGGLVFRDRVPCWVTEPNGILLSPGYYDCRLVGSFPLVGDPYRGAQPQYPLYATTCCPNNVFSSSSISSANSSSSGSSK